MTLKRPRVLPCTSFRECAKFACPEFCHPSHDAGTVGHWALFLRGIRSCRPRAAQCGDVWMLPWVTLCCSKTERQPGTNQGRQAQSGSNGCCILMVCGAWVFSFQKWMLQWWTYLSAGNLPGKQIEWWKQRRASMAEKDIKELWCQEEVFHPTVCPNGHPKQSTCLSQTPFPGVNKLISGSGLQGKWCVCHKFESLKVQGFD